MRSAIATAAAVAALLGAAPAATPRIAADSPPSPVAPLTANAPAALQPGPAAVSVSVGGPMRVAPIPASFVGVSMEYTSAADLAGPPSDADTVLQQLIRNLAPGQSPVIRIGGDSTDHTWYPSPGVDPSPGLSFELTQSWIDSIENLAKTLSAQLILGVNLEADQPQLAAAEAEALLRGIGRHLLEAFEVGNEPSYYAKLPWYRTADGLQVDGRPSSYGFSDYAGEVSRLVAGLPAVPLAAPALGDFGWMRWLGRLLHAEPRIDVVTFHRYPLKRCFTTPASPQYPTIANLLSRAATIGLANSVAPYAAIARDGVSGVNFHTLPAAAYRLFDVYQSGGTWSATVAPEYYGILMFVEAAPPGARLLSVADKGDGEHVAWGTLTTKGATHLVLINESAAQPATVTIRVPGTPGDRLPPAWVQRLEAPGGLTATGGVTLGGTAIASQTTTGTLERPPSATAVAPVAGTYAVSVPPASAALVTVQPAGQAR